MRISEQAVRKALAFGGAFLLMTGALLYLFLGDTAVAQHIRLSRASKCQQFLQPKLAADPRFKDVKVAVSTTNSGGTLQIYGVLNNEADLSALKAFITATVPPVPVSYRVLIDPH